MRILITTSSDARTLAREYIQAINNIDKNVVLSGYAHIERYHQLARSSLVRRLHSRLNPNPYFNRISAELLEQVKSFRPDVLWLFKGMEISPHVLRTIKESGVRLVNYNADHPINHVGRGSGNANVTDAIPLFDCYMTYSREIEKELHRKYPDLKTAVIPFGHSIADEAYNDICQDISEIPRLCFLGNPDVERFEFICKISNAGIPMDVYGNDWASFGSENANLRFHPAVLGSAYWRVLRQYRAQLNLFRAHNRNSHNMRSIEVPACGGVMLAPDTDEHRDFFRSGEEAYFFKDADEAILRSREILGAEKSTVDRQRAAARQRCVEDHHYSVRVKVALGEINKLLG